MKPCGLVIIQFLHDNPGAEMPDSVLENFSLRNLKPHTPTAGEIPQRYTPIEIDLLGALSDIDGDWVEFTHYSILLSKLFYNVVENASDKVMGWGINSRIVYW